MAKLLLEYGADKNRKSGLNAWTPLHAVILSELPEPQKLSTCRVILEAGAEYQNTVLDRDGRSPADVAAAKGLRTITALFENEGKRRREHYDKFLMEYQEKSAKRLSEVQSILAGDEHSKRAEINMRIDSFLQNLVVDRPAKPKRNMIRANEDAKQFAALSAPARGG